MKWEDLDKRVLENMKWLGNFSPTSCIKDRLVKGYMCDSDGDQSSVYLDSKELRELARDLQAVADFLDERTEN